MTRKPIESKSIKPRGAKEILHDIAALRIDNQTVVDYIISQHDTIVDDNIETEKDRLSDQMINAEMYGVSNPWPALDALQKTVSELLEAPSTPPTQVQREVLSKSTEAINMLLSCEFYMALEKPDTFIIDLMDADEKRKKI